MSNRRSNIEIIADILRLGIVGKTDILYGCDLSYHQMHRYLRFLLAQGFLKSDDDEDTPKRYKPTKVGEQLLSDIDKVRALLELRDRDAVVEPHEVKNTISKDEYKNLTIAREQGAKVDGR